MNAMNADRPIPFSVTDPDRPIPYRVRMERASTWLRDFVVPKLDIRPVSPASRARS